MIDFSDINGKVALVTGGGTGLGKGIVTALARCGSKVVINYSKSREAAEKLKKELNGAGMQADICQGDVRKLEDCKKIIAYTVQKFGEIDILVNNSGVYNARDDIFEIEYDDYDVIMDTNLKGTFYCSLEAAKYMAKQELGGSIVSISSIGVRYPRGGNAIYNASKAGIEVLMQSFAYDLGKYKVRLNCVAPGPTMTEMHKAFNNEGRRNEVLKSIPLGKYGEVEDIADAVLYFASDLSGHVTGQVLTVDGGRSIR